MKNIVIKRNLEIYLTPGTYTQEDIMRIVRMSIGSEPINKGVTSLDLMEEDIEL